MKKMQINRIAVIKNGHTAKELRAVLGEARPGDKLFDSYVPYMQEFVEAFRDKEVLFIGRKTESDRFDSGKLHAVTVNSVFPKEILFPLRALKRWKAERTIRRLIHEFRPQLVFSFGLYIEIGTNYKYAREIDALFVPIVVAPWINPSNPVRKFLWKGGVEAITDPAIPSILVRGDFLKDHLLELFNLPPEIIKPYWPVYPASFYENTGGSPFSQDRFNVLWVGRMDVDKGAHLLPEILLAIRDRVPNICLTLVGDGTLAGEIRDQLVKIDPAENLWRIAGFVPAPKIADYYNCCDVLIMPTLDEGFGKVAFEAQLCGAPVVASRIHNIPYLIENGKTGLLVEPGDVEGFVKAVIKLAKDRVFAESLGKRAAKCARGIKKPNLTSKLKELISELEFES